jgi:hypothetical protein
VAKQLNRRVQSVAMNYKMKKRGQPWTGMSCSVFRQDYKTHAFL